MRLPVFLAEVVYFSIPVNAKAMPAGVLARLLLGPPMLDRSKGGG